jgi:hypothetical protein
MSMLFSVIEEVKIDFVRPTVPCTNNYDKANLSDV